MGVSSATTDYRLPTRRTPERRTAPGTSWAASPLLPRRPDTRPADCRWPAELVAAKLVAERRAVRDVVQLHEHAEPPLRSNVKFFVMRALMLNSGTAAGVADAARHLTGTEPEVLVVS